MEFYFFIGYCNCPDGYIDEDCSSSNFFSEINCRLFWNKAGTLLSSSQQQGQVLDANTMVYFYYNIPGFWFFVIIKFYFFLNFFSIFIFLKKIK